MSKIFTTLEKVSSWRRLSTAMWDDHTSPQVLGFDDVDMTEIQSLCDDIAEEYDVKVTETHVAVATLGQIFSRHPILNAVLIRGKAMRRKNTDIFVQVAVGKGKKADLSGIKIRNADQKNVVEIATEIRDRAARVRRGEDQDIEQSKKLFDTLPSWVLRPMVKGLTKLSFDAGLDLTPIGVKPDPFGTAMVTNCAGFNVHCGFAPLIPASRTPMILLIGRTDDKPVVRDGEIVIRPMARMTMTFDHRLLDGYQIGVIVTEIKSLLEDPAFFREQIFG